jgi:hypothetical protein
MYGKHGLKEKYKRQGGQLSFPYLTHAFRARHLMETIYTIVKVYSNYSYFNERLEKLCKIFLSGEIHCIFITLCKVQ